MKRYLIIRSLFNKRNLLFVAGAFTIFLLIDTFWEAQKIKWRDYFQYYAGFSQFDRPSVYASFLILNFNLNSSSTPSKTSSHFSAEIKANIKVPACDQVDEFYFYVFKYAVLDTATFISRLNRSFDRCNRPVRTTVRQFVIPDLRNDGRFVRDQVLDAYLDGVDFYHIAVFTEETGARGRVVDLQKMKDDLIRRSSHGVGSIVDGFPRKKSTISGIFFSKIHLEIFGSVFPVTLGSLERALGYVVSLYAPSGFAAFADGKAVSFEEIQTQENEGRDREQMTVQRTQDLNVLSRYLSAVRSAKGEWRSVGSSRKVITMSLYGSGRRYTIGALRNAQLLPVVFPGWRLWFYCEQPPAQNGTERYGRVPRRILDRLIALGAEVRYVDVAETGLAPMLWRFLVADDRTVDAFVVRDSDSRFTSRDAAVVADWLRTNASFHCVRDHPSHSLYSVSGGLWGGRPRGLAELFNGTLRDLMRGYGAGYVADMNFLGQKVWPLVQRVAYCHDSFSCETYPASHPFPVERVGSEHLGQVYDENSVGRQGDINILAAAPINKKCVPTAKKAY